jgi:ribosome maturation factor RimP
VLRTSEHFTRFTGEPVRVELAVARAGRKRYVGRLIAVAERDITLDVDGTQIRLPLEAIHKARLEPAL